MHDIWPLTFLFAFYTTIGLAKVIGGLSERSKDFPDMMEGAGLLLGSGPFCVALVVEHFTGKTPPLWSIVASAILAALFLAPSYLLKDQQKLRANPETWGSPPTLALLPEVVWAITSCLLVALTVVLFITSNMPDPQPWPFLCGVVAGFAVFAWIRVHCRKHAPAWLVFLLVKSGITPPSDAA